MRIVFGTSTPIDINSRLRLCRLWHVLGAALIAVVFYLSLTPAPLQIPVVAGDKLGHVAAYATMMAWYAQLHANRGPRLGLACTFVAMGIAIEYLQRATGYRTFEAADMVADAIGVTAGWLLAPPRAPHALRWIETRVGRAGG